MNAVGFVLGVALCMSTQPVLSHGGKLNEYGCHTIVSG